MLTENVSDSVEIEIMPTAMIKHCQFLAQVKPISFNAARLETLEHNLVFDRPSHPVTAHIFQGLAE